MPVAVRGPDYVLDDWFALANAHFDGWWRAIGGELVRARPGSGVVYAVVFGLVGRHPLVALAVQVAIAAATAVALRALLRRFVPEREALAIAALWVLLPNHASLLYWTTGSALTVALFLLLVGFGLLADDRPLVAAFVLGASVLTYEATGPAAVVGLAAVPALLGRPWRRPLLIGSCVLGPVAVWVVAAIPSVKQGLDETADLGQLLPAHVGWGVLPRGWPATGAGLACTIVLTLLVVESARRRHLGHEAALALVGAGVIAVGTVPFLRYFYAPLGAGDRVHVVAAVGTALVWTAAFTWTWRHVPAALATPAIAVVLVGFAIATLHSADAWADAHDEAAAVLARVRPVHAGDRVVVPRSTLRRNVAPFLDDSNFSGAVQLEAGTRDVEAYLGPARPAG